MVFASGEKVSSPVTPANTIKQEVRTTANKVQESSITFLEFGSTTCLPCKMMGPILEEIRTEYPRVNVVFINVLTEEGNARARGYKVMSIPTQVFLDKDGQEYDRHVGFFPKAELVKVLEKGMGR